MTQKSSLHIVPTHEYLDGSHTSSILDSIIVQHLLKLTISPRTKTGLFLIRTKESKCKFMSPGCNVIVSPLSPMNSTLNCITVIIDDEDDDVQFCLMMVLISCTLIWRLPSPMNRMAREPSGS